MTNKILQEFKTHLISERKMILDKICDQEKEEKYLHREHNDGFEDHGYEPAVELLEKLTSSEANLIKKIDLALSKINNKTYGICISCDKEIPLNRLEAKPSVSLCVECQAEHEIET